MTRDGTTPVSAAIKYGAPSCRSCSEATLKAATLCLACSTACAVWAGSNGVSKAPRLLAARLADATAGTSATETRPAARAPAHTPARGARSDQTLMPIAAAATAMMAGTSQPGTRAPDEDTSQAAYPAVPATTSSRPTGRATVVRSPDHAAAVPAPMIAATGGDSAAV